MSFVNNGKYAELYNFKPNKLARDAANSRKREFWMEVIPAEIEQREAILHSYADEGSIDYYHYVHPNGSRCQVRPTVWQGNFYGDPQKNVHVRGLVLVRTGRFCGNPSKPTFIVLSADVDEFVRNYCDGLPIKRQL